MAFQPPKGVRPPQLEGKRTGRPKGSKNWACAWRDAIWGNNNRFDDEACPPTPGAALWQDLAEHFPMELDEWLFEHGRQDFA